MRNDCHIVVRSSGERTADACVKLASAEVGESNVSIVSTRPFSLALREGYGIGLQAGARWTLCLDADVLLRPGAVGDLIRDAEAELEAGRNLFVTTGKIADKVFHFPRPAGVHLYRTQLLTEGLECAMTWDERGSEIQPYRPEAFVKNLMKERGYPHSFPDIVTGLHDFEQYYCDLFRKIFLHSRKHGRFNEAAKKLWCRKYLDDADYLVMLWSMTIAEGMNTYRPNDCNGTPWRELTDRDLFAPDIDMLLRPAGLSEKEPLDADEIDHAFVMRELEQFRPPPEFLDEEEMFSRRIKSRWSYNIARIRQRGMMPWLRVRAGRKAIQFGRRWMNG